MRIGIDFGGTKIEAAALAPSGEIVARERTPNPGSYEAAIEAVAGLVAKVGPERATVGVGVPGSISPKTGLIRNANSQWLNGKPFKQDLEQALGRPIRMENDANCFALSEASDGAGAGADVVFGAILGTGCGGGVVVRGRTVEGVNGIAGEWGHTPLPWPRNSEYPGNNCWCGRGNCLETWISGTGFVEDFARDTGQRLTGAEIVALGDRDSEAALDRYIDRLARGLAVICDILDPDVIVLGGGMSNVEALYDRVRGVTARYAFSDVFETKIVKAMHGDSSGVRGAAWLWPT
jgi:fructokinase